MVKKSFRRCLVWVLTLAVLMGMLLPANLVFAEGDTGNTYYVATDGNDSNPGTIDAPFKSIVYAYPKLQSGDTLIIREGTYKGYVAFDGKQDITVKSYDGEKVTITPVLNIGWIATIKNSSNITISGIMLALDAESDNYIIMYIDASTNVKVTNCEFSGGEGAICCKLGCKNLEISNNTIYNTGWATGGVMFWDVQDSRVFNNVFRHAERCIDLWGAATTNNMFYNNTFYGNTCDVFPQSNSGIANGNIFRNNIFSSIIWNTYVDTGNSQEVKDFMKLNDFDNNCYNSVTMADGVLTNDGLKLSDLQSLGVEPNGFMGDPKYLNPKTIELQIGRGSACQDKAVTDFIPVTDILGQTRQTADLGAYAYADRTNYYLSATGSDSNAGTDAAPFATFAKAFSVMLPGDYLFIKAGTYSEASPGMSYLEVKDLRNITITNYQTDKPVIDKLTYFINCTGLDISGLEITAALFFANCEYKVTNMDFNKGYFLTVPGDNTNKGGYEVSGNKFHDNTGDQALYVAGHNGKIFNNVIYNNKSSSIRVTDGGCNNSFYNNTFYNNPVDLTIHGSASSGNVFKNNIFSGEVQMSNFISLKQNTFDYNCYNRFDADGNPDYIGLANMYNENGEYLETIWPSLAALQARTDITFEQNGYSGHPYFSNLAVNDFKLKMTSECIGKGTSEGAPAYDFNGLERTEPYDTGAYKFTGFVSEYYVSADGNDSNAGTVDEPYKTIQHAVDVAGSGETIFVKGGTYNENIIINNKKGSSSSKFQLKNIPGETVVLDSAGTGETALTIGQSSSFWDIQGLNIKDYTKNGICIQDGSNNIKLSSISIADAGECGIKADNTSNIALENVSIINAGSGIAVSGSTDWSIFRSSVNCTSAAAASLITVDGVKITSSLFTNSKTGISAVASSNLVIYNNDFYGNSESDMNLDKASAGNIVKNNIFGSEGAAFLVEMASADNDFNYNCYSKSNNAVNGEVAMTFAQFQALGKEANGIQADPKYTDPANGNFLLKPGSPCADKGISEASAPITGYDGYNFETPIDIGAIFSPYSNVAYYVSPTDGDDSNDGSFEHPWKTLGKGMNTMKQSDTLYLRGGIYSERVNLYNRIGREGVYFTIKNYNGEEAILDSNFAEDVGFKFVNCSYIKLDGLKFRNYTGAAIWVTEGSSHVVMENLEIYNIDNKTYHIHGTEAILGDGGYSEIRNCYIHDIAQTLMERADNGIYIGYGAHHWIIDSNRLENIPGGGINLYGKPSGGDYSIITNNVVVNTRFAMVLTMCKGVLVSNNTLINNWGADFYTDWWLNDCVIQNNILYNDLPADYLQRVEDKENEGSTKMVNIDPVPMLIQFEEVSGNLIRDNIVYNKYFGNRVMDIATIKPMEEYLDTQTQNTFENYVETDPMLYNVANGDYTPRIGSPCIDKGAAEGAPTVDCEGAQRTSVPDIGAYEYIKAGEEPPVIITPAPATTPTPTPTTTPAEPQFKDVEGSWAYKAIMNMAKAGVLTGYSDGTARPNANATRAEFVTFVTKLMKAEASTTANFSDINSSAWYMKYLSAAVEKGWIDGRTDGSFGPNDWITREEAMKIISKVIDSLGVQTTVDTSVLDAFKDKDSVSSWARNDVAKLVGLGIIEGSEGRLNPKARITRAEICSILDRNMEKYMNK